ncbi:MAG: TlpA family protein disulfide reductase [Candidatus Omnitrophica bacterium]|nr:TlpA family protein disulfide reductase [Candidatus Omnitrophota bacterium]
MGRFRVLSLIAVLLLGSPLLWRAAEAGAKAPDEEGFSVGQRPPGFSVLDLQGQRHSLKQYRGRVVVLHFWASWCPYCRGEIPKLLQVHEQGSPQGVTVLAVSVDQNLAQLQAFVQQAGLPYIVIPDAHSPSSIANAYGVRGIPVTYLLDRDGRIASRFFGSADLISAVQRLLTHSSKSET